MSALPETPETSSDSPITVPESAVVTVTESARVKLIELRDEEPDGAKLGVRIEILSETGADFTYDLSFAVVTKSDIDDLISNQGGLKVIVPAKDEHNLRGAELDWEEGGLVLRNPNKPKPLLLGTLTIDSPLASQVNAVIDAEINPSLAAHGGYVTMMGHDADNVVYMTMGGGCHGCAMSRMTMLQGVQTTIRELVPAVAKVVDVTDHTTGSNPYYQS